MIFDHQPWALSDQPEIIKKEKKKALRKGHLNEFITFYSSNVLLLPALLFKFFGEKWFTKRHAGLRQSKSVALEFYGLCVNLDKGDIQYELVEELGVKSLQIRFFLSDMDRLQDYVAFAKKFGPSKDILITIIQSRKHIENTELLKRDIAKVFEAFSEVSREFVVGNAINRIKWGFVSTEEYLRFYQTIQDVRDQQFPKLLLVGSSVIDFEYHFTIRTLFNRFRIHYDKVASLLYVDRRGSPYRFQYGIFDFKNKIDFLDTIIRTSRQCNPSVYVTETNWPILGNGDYAPTSDRECVSEDEYTTHMIDYLQIARESGKIDCVYWHQLVAPGFGLVDNRDGTIRKMPQYYAFKEIVQKCIRETVSDRADVN